MSLQNILKSLKTVQKSRIQLPSTPLLNPNHRLAQAIATTLTSAKKTLNSEQNDTLFSQLDPSTLHLILSNPSVKPHDCLHFFTYLQGNRSLIPFRPGPPAHLILISRLLYSRNFNDAKALTKSLLFDEDGTTPFHKLASFVEGAYDFDDDIARLFVDKLFNMVFNVYSDSGMFELASEVFDYMKSNDLVINERTCTIHLVALMRANLVELAVDFFYRMVDAGIDVSVYSLRVIVDGLCGYREVRRGRLLLEQVVAKGIVGKLNASAFSVLIDACAKRWNCELVWVMELMERAGTEFSLPTFKILIDEYVSAGKVKEAERAVSEMHDKGSNVDVYLYTSVIKGYCRLGNLEDGFLLFNKVMERGVTPDSGTYNTLLDGFCNGGQMEKAEKLVIDMQENEIELDKGMFTSIVGGFCKRGMMNEALKWLDEMGKKEIVANVSYYEDLVDSLRQFNQTAEINRLLIMMIKHGVTPNVQRFAPPDDRMGLDDKHKGDLEDRKNTG